MQTRWIVLTWIVACGAPPTPTVVAPMTAPPTAPSTSPSTAATPSPPADVPPVASAECAQVRIDLPSALPPCVQPGAKELRDVSPFDLAVEVTPTSARVKPGGSVDFTFTMTNKTKAPLRLVLADPPQPSLQVLDGKDHPIEPLSAPPPLKLSAACAHVDCPTPPLRSDTPRLPPPHELTLAPGGVARTHLTWRARKLAWPKTGVAPTCCPRDDRQPVDAGPLPPDNYRLLFFPPVSPNDSEQTLQHDEAQIEVAP